MKIDSAPVSLGKVGLHWSCPRNGIVTPLITPLKLNNELGLDEKGLGQVVEHVISGGVNGAFILGTTGEGPSLSRDLKREVIRFTCRETAGRIPVLVGVIERSESEIFSLAEFAAAQSATGLVLAPPFYLRLQQGELRAFIESVVPRLPLPTMLYNIPGLTKISMEPETLQSICNLPNLAGLKDSSGDLNYLRSLRRVLPLSFPIFHGPEEQLAEAIAAGADGGVCGGSNLFPKLFMSLYEAARKGDLPTVACLQSIVLEMSSAIHQCGASYPVGLKQAMQLTGISNGLPAPH